jgi:hypothetical protein
MAKFISKALFTTKILFCWRYSLDFLYLFQKPFSVWFAVPCQPRSDCGGCIYGFILLSKPFSMPDKMSDTLICQVEGVSSVQNALKDAGISDYERVVCYYTLPKIISPITIGLLSAYALCVLEAVAALIYGIYIQDATWTNAGLYCFIGIIIFGMVAFTFRAWLNEWRRRVALAVASSAPRGEADTDIPDPFENHVMLSRPSPNNKKSFTCLERSGGISHHVEIRRRNVHWRVKDTEYQSLFDVLVVHGKGQLRVYADKRHRASIERYMTLRASVANIYILDLPQRNYAITNGCIYDSGRLVGRIYRLRRRLYLDIEKAHLHDGLLAHFVSLR